MGKNMEREIILQKLKEQGYRITKPRRLLIDIILEEECSCCKDIYYKALKKNAHIGLATIYRMVNTLEELGAISRKNMYRITCDGEYTEQGIHVIQFEDQTSLTLHSSQWEEIIQNGLEACGYSRNKNIRKIEMV